MGELDGNWTVERESGLLPPYVGVTKRIVGAAGSTRIGPVEARFDVEGRTLRYRAPFEGLVDHVEPEGDHLHGRATYRGRELARFTMRRIENGGVMGIEAQLIKHIDEAHAMEQNVLRMLDSMIATTPDPDIVRELEHHRMETEGHALKMRQRLEAHGASPSMVKQAGGILGAFAKMPFDLVRGEKAGRNARDGFATEHMEIASYELLSRIAQKAGDEETVEACREILAEELAMADTIRANWDTFAELSLREEGVPA
jgi:ferritin-like metal-binding protein YciE